MTLNDFAARHLTSEYKRRLIHRLREDRRTVRRQANLPFVRTLT